MPRKISFTLLCSVVNNNAADAIFDFGRGFTATTSATAAAATAAAATAATAGAATTAAAAAATAGAAGVAALNNLVLSFLAAHLPALLGLQIAAP